jgi:hypothetical protein
MTTPATIEAQPDPRTPGRMAYRITSLYSPAAVQAAVAELMDADGIAVAEFTHVRRTEPTIGNPPVWQSLGYTLARRRAVAA